ncbi:Hypothetical predicted protein [Paramuricea clavata]|uniref:Uncharacterized protein n=1 Tax=Paramuricea clavata TaxID=317549 RepID=A0A6S7K4I2_PARCT|nr:Hypothetical predicted protein [Paramuricea clavata]
MDDTPALAISTEVVYKTAELYREGSPQTANLLNHSSYVDDLIDSRPSKPDALKIAKESEDILAKGGFAVKCWQFSCETQPRVKEELLKLDLPEKSVESSDQGLIRLKGTDENLRVLGLGWNPKKEPLPGEKKVHVAAASSIEALLIDYERFSSINKAIWVVARFLNIAKKKSFKGGRTLSISVKQLQEAENFIVKEVQKSIES